MRRYANIVSINENYEIETIFDIVVDAEYNPSLLALTNKIKSATIENVFSESYKELCELPYEENRKPNQSTYQLGVPFNHKTYSKEEAELYGRVEVGKSYTFNHINMKVPKQYINFGTSSTESYIAKFRDDYNVFLRALSEIHIDTLILVRDLIVQGSLINAESYLSKVKEFIKFKREYDNLPSDKRSNWAWVTSYNLPYARFRNELIGTLCIELTEGKDLNDAYDSWNRRADSANFMKAVAPVTDSMRKMARKDFVALGYNEGQLLRRHATINDIKASLIIHLNSDTKVKNISVFDSIKTSVSTRHKRAEFDKVEEVSIEKFMSEVVPNSQSLEVYFENKHEGNLVNLTTSTELSDKSLFKYPNDFCITYKGNLAGKSFIKENAKNAGGKIEGLLRCSLQWNDDDTKGIVDFDLHCNESKGSEIYYSRKKSYTTGGWLDVDMIRPHKIGIENITWQDRLLDMEYYFFVRNYCGGSNSGFKVEIEFDGNTYNYHYAQMVSRSGDVRVATVTVKNGVISIKHHLPETSNNKTLYNLETNTFHKVTLMCTSPNHWETEVGNKHYLFMLENCKTDDSIRGFHNEYLNSELLAHRKVMDILGNVTMIEPTDKQLAGLGFNATVRDEVIVKVKGSFQRVLKVKF